mgnify:CR=1 FL=1
MSCSCSSNFDDFRHVRPLQESPAREGRERREQLEHGVEDAPLARLRGLLRGVVELHRHAQRVAFEVERNLLLRAALPGAAPQLHLQGTDYACSLFSQTTGAMAGPVLGEQDQ